MFPYSLSNDSFLFFFFLQYFTLNKRLVNFNFTYTSSLSFFVVVLFGVFGGRVWQGDFGCMPGAHKGSQLGRRGKNKMAKTFMGQDEGSLITQKQRLHTEAKANKRFILYFPSPSNVQPLPRKYCFTI